MYLLLVAVHLWGRARHKCWDVRDRTSQDERVDVVRAFVRVHGFQIDSVADDVVLVREAVAAEHVTCVARDLDRLAARVALHHGDELHWRLALVKQTSDLQTRLETDRDLRAHVRELLLDQLVAVDT